MTKKVASKLTAEKKVLSKKKRVELAKAAKKKRSAQNKAKLIKTYRFRFYPTSEQTSTLSRWMGACRFVYNCGLEERNLVFQMSGGVKKLKYEYQQNQLPECRSMEGFEWLEEVPSQSLQMALRNLDQAFQNFLDPNLDAGYPTRKRKGKCTESICFPQGNRVIITCAKKKSKKWSYITGIPKITVGKGATPLKIAQHRKIEGEIKRATITRQTTGEWYISLSCYLGKKAEIIPINSAHKGELVPEKSVGIDLGVAKTICEDAQSDNEHNLDLKTIKKVEKQIATLQRRAAKQKKFSPRWKYYQKIVGKKHRKITRIRHDFLHKASNDICKKHAIVVLEDLRVKNMSKSAKGTLEKPGKNVAQKSGLNRSILRQGWGMFRDFVRYKSEWQGGLLVLVPAKNTSRRCRKCGHTSVENRQKQEVFFCVNCGHTENADKHAATVIKALGLQSLGFESEARKILEAPTKDASAA
ncbi:MAG: transposase [Halobacteriovoraceae bacterium]|nr:transposase [Halobacteriovoraceae bacterium]MCB9061679.1 transposase [Halobacteriovoraceae bacterium]MCB9062813.1 transposase [Halobacteriovoraceae bacterium]